MTIKPIRTDADYEAALERAVALMGRADLASQDRLAVLQVLIEKWEGSRCVMPATTPKQAIKFRMDQLAITSRDLRPYLGSKSRVSEILNGQRQLTIDQVRALHRHLNIPIQSLIGESKHEPPQKPSIASAAAIAKLKTLGVMKARETVDAFLARGRTVAPSIAMLRKSRTDRTNAKTDLGALEAWCAAVAVIAESKSKPRISRKKLDLETGRRVAQLSGTPDGIRKVEAELARLGIILVVLDHLPGTFLDGAALCRADGTPVIALTLRHDRLDNFWFTLLHEFAHVCCHLRDGTTIIVDDLEVSSTDRTEAEADAFAREALIPADEWKTLPKELSAEDLEGFAARLSVHPSIVAGRWRYLNRDYRRFSKLIGRGEVRAALVG